MPGQQPENNTAGIYYERPDGRIAYVYGFTDSGKSVCYYLYDATAATVSRDDFQTWKPRRDLEDFPESTDKRLPHAFDLFYDIKRESELDHLLRTQDAETVSELLDTMLTACREGHQFERDFSQYGFAPSQDESQQAQPDADDMTDEDYPHSLGRSNCPACRRRTRQLLQHNQAGLSALYGQVSREAYDAKLIELQRKLERVDESLPDTVVTALGGHVDTHGVLNIRVRTQCEHANCDWIHTRHITVPLFNIETGKATDV